MRLELSDKIADVSSFSLLQKDHEQLLINGLEIERCCLNFSDFLSTLALSSYGLLLHEVSKVI